VDKLKYHKEALASIKDASAVGAGEEEEGGAMDVERPGQQQGQGGRGKQGAAAPARVSQQQTTSGGSRHAVSKMSLR
jgi:hypothetical protein